MIRLKNPKFFLILGLVLILAAVTSMISIAYYEKDKPWLHPTGVRLCKDASLETCDESEAYIPNPDDGTLYGAAKRIPLIVFSAGTVMVLSGTIVLYRTIKSRQKGS